MIVLTVAQPPVYFGPREWAIFLLANVVIFYFCAGRLVLDIRRWIRPKR